MTLALDGTPSVNSDGGGAAINLSITTSNINDVIVVLATQAGGTGFTVSGGGLTWTQRAITNDGGANYVSVWWAHAIAPLTAATITVTPTGGSPFYNTAIGFGVSGANTTSPWDAGGPVLGTTSESLSITTVTANTFLIGYWASSNNTFYTPGSGFTTLDNTSGNNDFGEYQVVSSAGAKTVNVVDNFSLGVLCSIADAIVAASGGGGGATLASIAIPRKMFLPPKKKFYLR